MNIEELKTPVTEIEIARLLDADWTKEGKDIIRRLAFELNYLRAKNKTQREENER